MDLLLQELAAIAEAAATQCNYMKTLALLRALKAGSVSLDQVNMTTDGWTISAPVPPPPLPQPMPMPPGEPEHVALEPALEPDGA